MKLINKIIPLILIIYLLFPYECANASIIKEEINKDGIKTYYVSTPEENFIVFSIIKARMEQQARVIYSGEMANRDYFYLSDAVEYDNFPQYTVRSTAYNVGNFYSYSMGCKLNDDGTTIANYNIYYRANIEETEYVYDKIHNAIKENMSILKTDYQKAFWAYHWVIDNLHYDKTYTYSSAYDGFQKSGTVCSGYATLYATVMNELGLECNYVSGSVGEDGSGNHAWNIVKMDDEWYCVDPTWGDSKYGDKFFLKSKDTFITSEFGYHSSLLYDYYLKYGEKFSSSDYTNVDSTDSHPISPSVYNIEMDILKINILCIGEKYNFLIDNPDNIPIKFISTNSNIVKVNKNGVVIGKSKGTATVIAYNTELNISQSCKITIE